MNRLTLFQALAYQVQQGEGGFGRYLNDSEFFRAFYNLVLAGNKDAIDIGVHVGMQTDMMLQATRGHVFGFEASGKICDHLFEKYRSQPRVSITHCAISNVSGTADFFDTDLWGAGSLRQTAGMKQYCGDAFEKSPVRVETLDQLMPDHADIGLIKLDIEGAEILALDGAAKLIMRNRPFIVMEYCHNALAFEFEGEPITHRTLRTIAERYGYRVYNIFGICLADEELWETSVFRDTFDVFLVPEEQHARWTLELLPRYQYQVLDCLSRLIEWTEPSIFGKLRLVALPTRLYEIVNHSGREESLAALSAAADQLRQRASRDDIFSTQALSRRGEVLLGLLHDGKLADAYRLASIKDLDADTLAQFEQLGAGPFPRAEAAVQEAP